MSDTDLEDLKRKSDEHTRAIITMQVQQQHMVEHLKKLEGVLTRVTWLIVTAVVGAVLMQVVPAYVA